MFGVGPSSLPLSYCTGFLVGTCHPNLGLPSLPPERGVMGSWCRKWLWEVLIRVGGRDFPGDSAVRNPPAKAGDARNLVSIAGSWRSPGGGHGNPLQYSCLQNPMDRGMWRAAVHGVAKSRTRLKRLSTHTCARVGEPGRRRAEQSQHKGEFLGPPGPLLLLRPRQVASLDCPPMRGPGEALTHWLPSFTVRVWNPMLPRWERGVCGGTRSVWHLPNHTLPSQHLPKIYTDYTPPRVKFPDPQHPPPEQRIRAVCYSHHCPPHISPPALAACQSTCVACTHHPCPALVLVHPPTSSPPPCGLHSSETQLHHHFCRAFLTATQAPS